MTIQLFMCRLFLLANKNTYIQHVRTYYDCVHGLDVSTWSMDVVETGWWYTAEHKSSLWHETFYLDTPKQAFQAALGQTWTCSNLSVDRWWAAWRFETTSDPGNSRTFCERRPDLRRPLVERLRCQSAGAAFGPSWYTPTCRPCRIQAAVCGWL